MTREDLIADLTDSITSGCFTHSRICLASILEDFAPLVSHDDIARLIAGDSEARLDILDRVENHASETVRNWLENTAKGRALVDAELERRQAEELEDQV
jgi:hypothetical protein